jgi:hypothetical protein
MVKLWDAVNQRLIAGEPNVRIETHDAAEATRLRFLLNKARSENNLTNVDYIKVSVAGAAVFFSTRFSPQTLGQILTLLETTTPSSPEQQTSSTVDTEWKQLLNEENSKDYTP